MSHMLLQPKKPAIATFDGTKSCGRIGIILQSQDSNGNVFIGPDQAALAGPPDINSNASDGFSLQKQTSVTNMPSTIVIAPYADCFYAYNAGAGPTILSVTTFRLE